MKTKKGAALLASAAAGLLLVGSAAGMASSAHAEEGVECYGVNKCKATGECGGKGHSCAGKNDCAGQGWLKLPKDACLKIKGGRLTPDEQEKPKS